MKVTDTVVRKEISTIRCAAEVLLEMAKTVSCERWHWKRIPTGLIVRDSAGHVIAQIPDGDYGGEGVAGFVAAFGPGAALGAGKLLKAIAGGAADLLKRVPYIPREDMAEMVPGYQQALDLAQYLPGEGSQ